MDTPEPLTSRADELRRLRDALSATQALIAGSPREHRRVWVQHERALTARIRDLENARP